jgi:hypothetical protein
MNLGAIIAINIFAVVCCAIAATLNFMLGNIIVGSIMVGLAVMNAGLAALNLSR